MGHIDAGASFNMCRYNVDRQYMDIDHAVISVRIAS